MDRTQAGHQEVLDSLVERPAVRVLAQAGSDEEDGIVPPTLLATDVPSLLPPELRDANPGGLLRRVNGELTTEDVTS